MGIYIKGMEMPSSCNGCWNCDINNMDGSEAKEPYFCLIKMKFVEEDFETCRPKWCPLIKVPDGHGRLIDADALCERIERQRNTEYAMKNRPHGTWERVLNLPLDMISDAPTIIEAGG